MLLPKLKKKKQTSKKLVIRKKKMHVSKSRMIPSHTHKHKSSNKGPQAKLNLQTKTNKLEELVLILPPYMQS